MIIWYFLRDYSFKNNYYNFSEALSYFPMHLIITIGYYAVCSVCYKILFINDCKKEYAELITELDEGKKFFEKNNIIYN